MLDLIRRARRRLLQHGLFEQAINALSVAFGGAAVLLLSGAGSLGWFGAAAATAGAAVVGLWLARRRLATPYRAAQMIDARLNLADSLSTAVHFSKEGTGAEIELRQREQAERLAATVDLHQALPFVLPRQTYVLAAMVLVCGGVMVLRYGISRRLDLSPSLMRLMAERRKAEGDSSRAWQPPVVKADDPAETATPPSQQGGSDADKPVATADPNAASARNGEKQDSERGGRREGQDAVSQRGETPDSTGAQAQASGSSDRNQQQPTAPQGKPDASPNENTSLLSKAKEALQNLFSRASPRPQNSEAAPHPNANHESKPQGTQGQSTEPSQGQSGQAGDEADNMEQETTPSGQTGQAKAAPNSNSRPAGGQPGSGAGNNDGDKTLRQAEQLAAMGKISRIIGKRSATVTGDAMVEVESTTQEIRTPYAPGGARHSQGGAAINRDQIPVALEGYVERYFEQLRNQAAAKSDRPR